MDGLVGVKAEKTLMDKCILGDTKPDVSKRVLWPLENVVNMRWLT